MHNDKHNMKYTYTTVRILLSINVHYGDWAHDGLAPTASVYIYIYIYIDRYVHIYIYIERERKRGTNGMWLIGHRDTTVWQQRRIGQGGDGWMDLDA